MLWVICKKNKCHEYILSEEDLYNCSEGQRLVFCLFLCLLRLPSRKKGTLTQYNIFRAIWTLWDVEQYSPLSKMKPGLSKVGAGGSRFQAEWLGRALLSWARLAGHSRLLDSTYLGLTWCPNPCSPGIGVVLSTLLRTTRSGGSTPSTQGEGPKSNLPSS